GRISPWDTGMWSDAHGAAFARVASFIKSQGAAAGVQLAHARRTGSPDPPRRGGRPLGRDQGAWQPLAPSAVPFDEGYPVPREMTRADVDKVVADFAAAARRAVAAGFDVIEVHAAH